jgi:hypothetical protein
MIFRCLLALDALGENKEEDKSKGNHALGASPGRKRKRSDI